MLGRSKRDCATSVQITTQSSNRLRKLTRRRPTCSQTRTSSLMRRTFPFRGSVVRRTQCPSVRVALCITPSLAWLVVILQGVREERHWARVLFHCLCREEDCSGCKEKLCHTAVDDDTELKSMAENDKEKKFEIPDGNFITVGVSTLTTA